MKNKKQISEKMKYPFYKLTLDKGGEVELYSSSIVRSMLLDIHIEGLEKGNWSEVISRLMEIV